MAKLLPEVSKSAEQTACDPVAKLLCWGNEVCLCNMLLGMRALSIREGTRPPYLHTFWHLLKKGQRGVFKFPFLLPSVD